MSALLQYAVGGAQRPDTFSGMQAPLRTGLEALFAAAPPEIQQNLRITSGYRSPQRQAEILQGSLGKRVGQQAVDRWNSIVARHGGDVIAAGQEARPWLREIGITKWVAPPGSSNHQKGDASDLKYLNNAARQWAHQNAGAHGLHFPLSNEDWHVEAVGSRGGQPASSGTPVTVANSRGLGAMFAGTPMAEYNPAPAAPFSPVGGVDPNAVQTVPVQGFGDLAMAFAAPAIQRQEEEAAQQAEQTRRAALFGNLGAMFG